ncbi:hypothetical protein [Psychroserpens sp.]|uniref:hypothetical protein n=1 Tax=Psychroserpens sp. TaxID=2020870 RepID=UPI00385A61B8
MKYFQILIVIGLLFTYSCGEDIDDNLRLDSSEPNLVIKFKFDSNQQRLGNLGQPVSVAPGNAAQSPGINKMSANYIELAPTSNTPLETGEIIYVGEETTSGGTQAIDFQNALFAGNNQTFLTIPLSDITSGDYEWVRVSLAYQEGTIDVLINNQDITGTLGSFVGYNSYITSFDLNESTFDINANKLQGFWAFEASGFSTQGQAPEGATTVPNPIFDSSPIPSGSCVVTGEFENVLSITGNETEDIEITLSFSINNSFEWTEVNADGKYEPNAGEQVVDMGLRGLIPLVSN